MMNHRMITGGGGTRLHVVECGNASGPAVIFLHGFSQCWLAWERQLDSELARDCRLIAMDLRGHGESAKPTGGYDDSKLWAEDIDACIRELRLKRPVLCGWSYGPIVMLDYVRHYGEDCIAGLHFVGAITKLGTEAALSVLSPELLALVPGFFSTNADDSVHSLDGLLRICFASEVSTPRLYTMLGYNASVPPSVRQALFSRVLDNDDLLRALRVPVLISHGEKDAVVKRAAVDQHRAEIHHAEVDIVANAGHAAFWDNAVAFNKRLAEFVNTCSSEPARVASVG